MKTKFFSELSLCDKKCIFFWILKFSKVAELIRLFQNNQDYAVVARAADKKIKWFVLKLATLNESMFKVRQICKQKFVLKALELVSSFQNQLIFFLNYLKKFLKSVIIFPSGQSLCRF